MISMDTETTGIWWQHGTVPFGIGWNSKDEYHSFFSSVNPFTRQLHKGFKSYVKRQIRDVLYSGEPVIFQNANFDLKALASIGIIDWQEPADPSFWDSILEMGHYMHLYNSCDAFSEASLKVLVPKYLGHNYDSETELDRIVNRCRIFVKNRDEKGLWKIASEDTTPGTDKFNKSDMWLPQAILDWWPDQDEVKEYFTYRTLEGKRVKCDDYHLLGSVVSSYLYDDCVYTRELGESYTTTLMDAYGPEELERLLSMNRAILPTVWKMETLGLPVRKSELDESIDTCTYWMGHCQSIANEAAGTDPMKDSFTPAELRKVLYEDFELTPTKYTEKAGHPATDQKTLLKLLEGLPEGENLNAEKFLAAILAQTKYNTKKKYMVSYQRLVLPAETVPYDIKPRDQKSSFLFPAYKSTGTSTTRFSSKNPNGQNIEKASDPFSQEHPEIAKLLEKSPGMRTIFGPEDGRWWFPIDYSQLQLRIFAYATQDPALIQSFKDGYDFHDFMAHVIFDLPEGTPPTTAQRRIAKNVNFGFIFGASERKIDSTAGRPGLYSYLMQCFPNAHEFLKDTKARIKDEGLVYTLGGYPLRIPLRESPWGGYSYAAHMGVNYIVQGTEGEIVKKAVADTDRYLSSSFPKGRLVMLIHDEIVFDMPALVSRQIIGNICRIMEDAGDYYGVETPVEPELCRVSLAEKERFEL